MSVSVKDLLSLIRGHVSFRHPRLAVRQVKSLVKFLTEKDKFKRLSLGEFTAPISLSPMLKDGSAESGVLTYHYFFQDLWMARQVFKRCPSRLIDVGSRIDGFVAHVASFREVEVLDIRPLRDEIPGVTFHQYDLTSGAGPYRQSVDAVSCLHVLEHFGLGRYGDSLDPAGHIKGLDSLYTMLRAGGLLFFSTIIGRDRVEFNAHRVFSLRTLMKLIEDRFEVLEFGLVSDTNKLIENVVLSDEVVQANAGQNFGCGLFVLRKIGC